MTDWDISELPATPPGYHFKQTLEKVDGHQRVLLQLFGPWGREVGHARVDLEMYGLAGVRERAQRMLEVSA